MERKELGVEVGGMSYKFCLMGFFGWFVVDCYIQRGRIRLGRGAS